MGWGRNGDLRAEVGNSIRLKHGANSKKYVTSRFLQVLIMGVLKLQTKKSSYPQRYDVGTE